MVRKVLIDTDTASDDATAILMGLRSPEVDVVAITLVSGNMPVDQGVKNALYTVHLCGKSTPVYRGAAQPLVRVPVHAEWFHGPDGMSGMNYPPPPQQVESKHAVDAIVDTIKANPGIEVLTLGPLTNVALAVARAPEIAGLVSRCVVMGGNACTEGNVTPAAEYNIWCDPEAARIVFHSGLPVEMVGWEHSRWGAVLTADDMAHIRSINTAFAHFVLDCNQTAMEAFRTQTGEIGLSVPDAVAMAVVIDPTIITSKSRHYVDVETMSELTRGMTVVDRLGVTHDERNRDVWAKLLAREPNVTVCWQLDLPRWKELLYQLVQ